ncbi:hypothetical protein D3C80_1576610 [compost metagenome]
MRGDAVDNTRVPVIEHGHQVVQEDDRHAGIGTEFPIGERHPAHVNPAGRHIFPLHIVHLPLQGGGWHIVPGPCGGPADA